MILLLSSSVDKNMAGVLGDKAGGYKTEHLASDIVWAPVNVESWWQVAIDDITFNNQPKNLCNGQCQVAVDTGTSMLAGPSDLVDKLSGMVDANDDCSNFD